MRRDDAISDVVGTVLTLAVTLVLFGVAAAQFDLFSSNEVEPPHASVRVAAEPGSSTITLTHVGGDGLDQGDLRLVVSVNGAVVRDVTVGASGDGFATGDTVTTTLPSALDEDDLVDVSLVSRGAGATVATTSAEVPADDTPPSPPVGFSVAATYADSSTSLTTFDPASFVVLAAVDHPDGRKTVASVILDAEDLNGDPSIELLDEGTNGDDVAGDGVWSAVVTAFDVSLGDYDLDVTATDVDGSTATDSLDLEIEEEDEDDDPDPRTVFSIDHTYLEDVALQMFEYAGTGTGDKLTMHLKLDMPATVAVGGATYALNTVKYDWNGYKPGNDPPVTMSRYCQNTVDNVEVWQSENNTIEKFEREFDNLNIFFILGWTKLTGTGAGTLTTELGSTDYSEMLLYPKSATMLEVRNDGWPLQFGNCNDA